MKLITDLEELPEPQKTEGIEPQETKGIEPQETTELQKTEPKIGGYHKTLKKYKKTKKSKKNKHKFNHTYRTN